MRPKIFTILKDNNVLSYDVVATFLSTKSNNNYVIYTDNTYDKDDLKLYAAIYNPDDFSFIANVTKEEDWMEIYEFLEKAFKKTD